MGDVQVQMGVHSAGSSQPIALQTKDLCYHVSVSDKTKPRRCCGILSRPTKQRQILDNVSVLARPGELTAIMGPSGSGKTTLLELISARVTGNTTGDILINGEQVTRRVMTKIAGYVKQKDILLPSATVRECIDFSAKLRLPAKFTSQERTEQVDTIIEKLGLTKCADTKVGDDVARGVSGGELKRTAIGVELITQPNLLFLDEPTSGLDSSSAFTIVDTLKKLARDDGTTVVCTLHQPRANIVNLFDRLILLHAGRIIYQGPPEGAVHWFTDCGHPCPPYTNPADFFMDVITDTNIPSLDVQPDQASGSMETSRSETPLLSASKSPAPSNTLLKKKKKRKGKDEDTSLLKESDEQRYDMEIAPKPESVDEMIEHWRSSKLSKRSVKFKSDSVTPIKLSKRKRDRKPGMAYQTWVLMGRAWKNNLRNPLILWAQLSQHLLLSLFIGLMYLNIGKKDNSLTDRAAAIFFALLNISWVPALTAAFVFPAERPLFNRERAGGFYNVLPYYLATTLTDLPLQILMVILNCTITYWMLGLHQSFIRFLIFTAIVFLCLMVTQSIALWLSALSPTADVANLLAGLVLLLFMAFGGFLLSAKNVPPYFYPIQYTSPYRYAFRALMQNDLNGITLKCSPFESACPLGNVTIATDPPLYNSTVVGVITDPICMYPCPYTEAKASLESLGLSGSSVIADSMILLGELVIMRVGIYICLEFITVGGS
jgi:ABC-type multidrug transport system ATPase subunit/ABC-type multidrug transport system permease subunit